MDDELAMAMAAAGSSECSSGCQSGWTTYLDDHSSYSCGTARFHGKARQTYYCDYSEEDDLSMVSDASSGPRQQSSASNDVEGVGGGAAAARAYAERRGRREEAAAARRQSKRAAAASQLEDTASFPAFFGYSKAMGSGEANGYGGADAQMMEIGNAADFSYAFSTTTGFKSPLNGTALGGCMQMQCSPAPVKPSVQRRAGEEEVLTAECWLIEELSPLPAGVKSARGLLRSAVFLGARGDGQAPASRQAGRLECVCKSSADLQEILPPSHSIQ